MIKAKTQKGITLVALIITIVVLLILAVVAINAIQNDDLISKANSAATRYNQSVGNETEQLGNYADVLNGYLPNGTTGGNGGTGSGEVPTVTPKVGQKVEYDISYDDMYNSTSSAKKTFGKTDGWRYLGTESGTGNHLLISTGVPMILYYNSSETTNSAQWWDTTQTNANANAKMAEGLKKKLASIPYAKVSAGTISTTKGNTMIGLFGEDTRTTVGDYFKVTGESYSNSIKVRTLTLDELKAANGGTESGFKDLKDDALGLFDLSDIGLSNNYYYWLASPYASHTGRVLYVTCGNSGISNSSDDPRGVRPVVVLPSSIQFTDVGSDGLLEIK